MNGEVSLNQDFRRKLRVIPGEYFFGFYKTRHVLLPDSANCTVLRAVVLTQYRRVTDGQTDRRTDGIAVASTALAMRALRRAVKTRVNLTHSGIIHSFDCRVYENNLLLLSDRISSC